MRLILLFMILLATPAHAGILVIRNVTVIDPSQDVPLERHDVVIEDGTITAVVPTGSIALPEARIIEGGDRYLIPGLADMHVHLEHFDDPAILRKFLAHGITFVRNMDGNPRILEWRDRVARGELHGPEIFTAGPIIDGARPADDAYVSAGNQSEGKQAVDEMHAAGYDFIKTYHGIDGKTFHAIQRAAAERGMRTAGHIPFRLGLRETIRQGLGSVEHLDGYDDLIEAKDSPYRNQWHWRKLVFAFPVDADAIREAASLSAARNVWNVPTLMVKDWRWLDPKVREERERLAATHGVSAAMREAWNPENWKGERAGLYDNLNVADHAAINAGYRNALQFVGALHAAGAPLMAGTDTPNPYVIPGFSLHEELQHLVAAGVTPLEALRTTTTNPARWLRREDRIGCIRKRCRADLVLLEDNPLIDIEATRRIVVVIRDGKPQVTPHENVHLN